MVEKRHGISLDLVIHPGETIADILEDRNITQKELAKRAGVSEPFLSDVIRGKKDISKSLAMGLEYALSVPSSFWLNLQANYDAELLILQEEQTISEEEKSVLSTIHEIVDYLIKTGTVSSNLAKNEMIIQLRKFFRISNLANLSELAPTGAFRLSGNVKINQTVLGAWICLCKIRGENNHVLDNYDNTKIKQLTTEIKKIMCNYKGDFQNELTSIFARYGINFSVVHNFRGAPVHGYIDRKEDGSYQMVVTIRGSYADIFWFSVFHELGHIANGDLSKEGSFIDLSESENVKREQAADRFASDALLDPDSYDAFIERGSYTIASIKDYAKTQNVPPFVVIGRLQKEKKIPWNRFANYKPRYKWVE